MDQHPRRLEECLSFGGSSASRYAGLVPSFVRHIVFGIDNTVVRADASLKQFFLWLKGMSASCCTNGRPLLTQHSSAGKPGSVEVGSGACVSDRCVFD